MRVSIPRGWVVCHPERSGAGFLSLVNEMAMITAFVRQLRASAVIRALHNAGVGGLTAYAVHGISGEKSTFLHSSYPFEPAHLPESIKIEVICDEGMTDQIVGLIAQEAKTGAPGDGIIAIQHIDRVVRIKDL
jgi:nitrogen regulatory protein P-II 1